MARCSYNVASIPVSYLTSFLFLRFTLIPKILLKCLISSILALLLFVQFGTFWIVYIKLHINKVSSSIPTFELSSKLLARLFIYFFTFSHHRAYVSPPSLSSKVKNMFFKSTTSSSLTLNSLCFISSAMAQQIPLFYYLYYVSLSRAFAPYTPSFSVSSITGRLPILSFSLLYTFINAYIIHSFNPLLPSRCTLL